MVTYSCPVPAALAAVGPLSHRREPVEHQSTKIRVPQGATDLAILLISRQEHVTIFMKRCT